MKATIPRALIPTLALFSASAPAAILARYEFGTPGQETILESSAAYNPTVTGAGMVATAITDPLGTVGIEISSAATVPANAPFLRLDPQGNSVDAAQALTNNKYFQFTLTPDVGNVLDLTSLTFDATRGGGGTPRGYFVRFSLNGFTTDLAGGDLSTVRPSYTPVSIDLSGFADTSSAVTFRIYSYAPAVGNSVDYDNITVNGNIVPEPATAVVFALGMAAMGLRGAVRGARSEQQVRGTAPLGYRW